MVCDRPACDWRFPAVVGVDAACFQQVVQVFQWSPSRCQFWSLACARLCSRVSSTGHVIGKLERPLARPRREAHEAIQHARGWPRCHAQPRSRRSDDQNLDFRADEDKTNTRYLGFTRWRLCVITQFELASTCTSLSQGYCTLQYKAPPGLAPRKTAFRRTVTGGVNNERIVVRAVTNS